MDVLNFLNFLAGIVSCGISIFLAIFTPRMKKSLKTRSLRIKSESIIFLIEKTYLQV